MGRIYVLCVATFLIFACHAEAANLLSNNGFETGNFTSWTRQYTPIESGSLLTATGARSGAYGLWIYTAGSSSVAEAFSYIHQDIQASPGETITASAYIRTPAGPEWAPNSYACVRVVFLSSSKTAISSYDSPHLTTGNTPYGSPYTVTTPAAPAGTAYVRFMCYLYEPAGDTRQSVANFDDCSLEKSSVPVPQLSVTPVSLGFGNDLGTLTFNISNTGDGTLSWTITKNSDWIGVSAASGTTTTETDTITVTVDRTGLKLPDYNGTITVTSNSGTQTVDAFMETAPVTVVPAQPSIVTTNGYQLMVQKRLPGGNLDIARPYIIKGAAWAPTSIGTLNDVTSRRNEFGNWYRLDIQLLKEMNANTVYVFLDFGTSPALLNTAKAVLDYCYQNGIMVVMTVDEDGSDNTANITSAVNAFKDHPAILMWALGNEWNLWRPDRPLYYARYTTLAAAANAMQANALQVKSLDTNHPVASILGEINYPTQGDVNNIVNNVCTAVDVWGANIYRGPEFYALFTEWKGMSAKPLFLSEFGTDAFHSTSWWPVVGSEDQAMQNGYVNTLWLDLAQELSANDSSKVCLGGTVFEWNDEWWKTPGGSPSAHDPDGYYTDWNPIAHPDSFANEEWFGIVSVRRERRPAYYTLQNHFSYVLRLTIPVRNKESYSSAAVCETILDYIRAGIADDLAQSTIYSYGHFYNLPENGALAEMDAKGVDAALGHYDPYDTTDPNGGGDPFKGYNYSVDTYDSSDPYAFRNYLRDICHWIDYPVATTYMGSTLVSKPNTPAAVPLYGNYDHWVVINGFSSSQDPLPLPGTNPWYTPDFVVNGFWVTDPAVSGLGYNVYVTSAECEKTYFKAMTTGDIYNGKFVQIAEPPRVKSKAMVKIYGPVKDLANLEFVGVGPVPEPASGRTPLVAMPSRSNSSQIKEIPSFLRKKSWRDLVDPHLLTDSEAISAFEGTRMGKALLVKRPDAVNSDYYLVPFGKYEHGVFLVSAVIILDARDGYFKETSWTGDPEKLLEVEKNRALSLVMSNVLKDIIKELKSVPLKPVKTYASRRNKIIMKYPAFLRDMRNARAELIWTAGAYSPSPYKPYWQVTAARRVWCVTQEEKVLNVR